MRLILTLAALTLTVGTGCGVFYDQSETNSVTTTTFTDELPSSLETVFAECAEPLQLNAGMDEIDLAGSCDQATDVSGAGPQTVLIGALINGPVDLGAAIESTLYSGSTTIAGFPWPMQNCEVDLDYTVRFDGLGLRDLMAGWRTHNGLAALWIDFDFLTWEDVISFRVDHDVDCPSRLNESALTGAFNLAIPSGWRQLSVRGLDLDLWVTLADGGSDLVGGLDLDVDVSEIDTDTYLSNIPGNLDQAILNGLGFTLSNIESEVEARLLDALADLPDTVADTLANELPDGHIVCSVAEVGRELVIKSDDPGRLSCRQVFSAFRL